MANLAGALIFLSGWELATEITPKKTGLVSPVSHEPGLGRIYPKADRHCT